MAITKIGTPELFDFSSLNTALQLPTGTTAERPGTLAGTSAPVAGEWRYNTTLSYVEYYDGAAWFQIDTEVDAVPVIPSGNFNTSTYFGNGATQTVDAKFNEAANFNGSSSKITTSAMSVSSTSSVSMWLNSNNTTATERRGIIEINSGVSGYAGTLMILYRFSDGEILVRSGNSNTAETTILSYADTSLRDGDWHHLVVTRVEATSVTVLYIDGAQVDTETIASTSTAGNATFIGDRQVTSAGNFNWDGKIDQVRIFNTALNQNDVDDLYAETTTTAATLNYPVGAGCIAAYQLDGDASDVGGTYGGVETDIGYTGLKFQPDFVWIKARDASCDHNIGDSVRGVSKALNPNTTAVQGNQAPNGITVFGSNGFTVVDNSGGGSSVNGASGGSCSGNLATYVAWNWYGGGAPTAPNTNGAGLPPTAGSVMIDGVSSTAALAGTTPAVKMSVNTAAGFSVVKYTQGGAANVAHGLSGAPELIINKIMLLAPSNWPVYVSSSVVSAAGFGKYISLDDSSGIVSSSGVFSNVDATTFTSNWSGTTFEFINYCFISIPNYQKIGSYVGTNAPGNIISTELTVGDGGFEPALVMIKSTGATNGNWIVLDNKRNSVNPRTDVLKWDTNGAETTEAALDVTFATNGFVLNGAAGAGGTGQINSSGITYIYLAIAADEDTSVPTLANSFETVLYTGNGGTQNISTSFAPDFVWLKHRNNPTAHQHNLFDTIRGVTESIHSNSDQAEETVSGGLTAFNSNGFSIGSDNAVNQNSYNYVSWNWKAGGLPTINTDGSIASIVSANVAAGFSIVKYNVGTQSNSQTIGHGLESPPEIIIDKIINLNGYGWTVYTQPTGLENALTLNSSAAVASYANFCSVVNDSIFQSKYTSASNTQHIAYCFTSITGYQKIGSYTWTGTSYTAGTMVTGLGFTPRFVMIKGTDVTSNWMMYDNQRVSGTQSYALYADEPAAESTSGFQGIIFDSDGFSAGAGADGNVTGSSGLNENGKTYIYLAIA